MSVWSGKLGRQILWKNFAHACWVYCIKGCDALIFDSIIRPCPNLSQLRDIFHSRVVLIGWAIFLILMLQYFSCVHVKIKLIIYKISPFYENISPLMKIYHHLWKYLTTCENLCSRNGFFVVFPDQLSFISVFILKSQYNFFAHYCSDSVWFNLILFQEQN